MNNGISHVLQRIHAIEQKFSPKMMTNDVSFQNTLKAELKMPEKQSLGKMGSIQSTNEKANQLQSKPVVAATSLEKAAAPADRISNMVAAAAHKYGVDPRLAMAIAKTESNYEPAAVSEAGAVGVMQLMPDTAAALGVNNIYDPQDNIEGGVKYIKQLLNNFNGNVTEAIAAYNAGPQAVKTYGGIPPYAETKNYVEQVLDLYS